RRAQPSECDLQGDELAKYIGVIEFDRCEDHHVGKVVQKFRTFIEESGVVLVAYDDEVLAVVLDGEAAAKIFRNAANQERRRLAREVKYPGEHGSRGGFAVRAGNAKHFAAE